MDAHAQIAAQWEHLKTQDSIKEKLFETMLQMYQDAIAERQGLIEEIAGLKYNEKNLHRDRTDLELRIQTLRAQSESSPFVLVLVDGDAAPFRDEFVKDGVKGGRRAVHELNEQIKNILEKSSGYQPHWQAVVRVYAKLSGLAMTYFRSGIVDSPDVLQQFVRGFNQVHPLSAIVDAGNDKEGADTKVEQNLKLFARNSHCKQIVLAASADKSYIRHLRPYALSNAPSSPIMLIESIPFPNEFKELASHFSVKQLAEILRGTKIETVVDQSVVTPVIAGQSYASKALQRNTSGESPPPFPTSTISAPSDNHFANKDPKAPKMCLNRNGERIDRPLGYVKSEVVEDIKNKKLCNRHFLTKCTAYACQHQHNHATLSNEQKNALRRVARYAVCFDGLECRDACCTSAHNCAYTLANCNYGLECKYPHAVDLKIVKEVEGY